MKGLLKDKRNLVILLLTILFLIKAPQEEKRFVFWMVGGVTLCGIFDFLINRLFLKREVLSQSAIISGFILSGILDYHQPIFVLTIFSFLGIASKYILRFNKKNIFNPANFALFLAALFKLPLTWNIEANIFLIITSGIYFTYHLKKYFHILGFLIFFTSLFILAKTNPFSLISYFFIFIMLIEPKTSGYGALRGLVFGSIAGISSFLIFKFLPGLDYFVSCLFIANLFNPILDRIRTS